MDEMNTGVEPTAFEIEMSDLMVWDDRMKRGAVWYGFTPPQVTYRLISDSTMLDLTAYTLMMPTDIPSWTNGKRAEQAKKNAKNFHVFEAALPNGTVWLGATNTIPMNINVMAHAVYGHVALCNMSFLTPDTEPETALERFAQYRNKVYKLIRDPRWGWDGVEYILDAANALALHCGRLPTIAGRLNDDELREQLEAEAESLRERIAHEGQFSTAEEKVLKRKLATVEANLKRHPIAPTDDLIGFLRDRRNTPNMDDETRMLLDVVWNRSRFVQPVGRSKFMHEGWSSFWEKKCLQAPHMGLPFEYMFDLAKAWSMHDHTVATNFYFDPYSMGVRVWEYIDRKTGFDEGEVAVERPVLKRNKKGFLYESKQTETVTAVKRNYEKMFEIGRNYEDTRFLTEFLNQELLEEINTEALGWVVRYMTKASNYLRSTGWGPQVVFDPLPTSLDELLKICQVWLEAAQQSEYYHKEMGTPMFPVPPFLVQHMVQVLQIVKAYDQNSRALQKMLVRRTGMQFVPNIYVSDDGRNTDNVLTLKHEFDPTWGPLLQSEARETLLYFGRLWKLGGRGAAVRLLTMEIKTDRQGNPVGAPFPYEYILDGDTVKERALT
jgi:spore cortex formation protein SpoVR/YcgB (stage V sporulation)